MEGRSRTRSRVLIVTAAGGVALGYTVTRLGFADFGEVNAMFTFQDLRMMLAFAGAVVLVVAVFLLLRPHGFAGGRVHAGVVPGAVLFGTGWAISGGCPSIPLVQLASGYLPAIVTVTGIAVGMWAARWTSARFLPVDRGSCGL